MKFQLFTFLSLLFMALGVAAQSRRSEPLPTGLSQYAGDKRSPQLLAEILIHQDQIRRSRAYKRGGANANASEKKSIIGVGHLADELPLDNSQRLKRGLPLKPPPTRRYAPRGSRTEQ
ncbi:uncharacterized protein I303_106819 [Kwoniella dejecticola CBS 10117]|uniref:Secreted protein n=1 Tax=Kwoniella dejecticola CBS 10117 TaxID=1296121 RepID=A0A1A5ZTL2_9TREE|nr:uncharacterized protein I303_08538 [Kwoniella dejecticola CBS 10117]OBR81154.1 hypothetical protein I303_08538 [Kwoniella dejecticola CBS 10117]